MRGLWRWIWTLFLFAIFESACTFHGQNGSAAQVGDFIITRADVQYRDRLIELYYPHYAANPRMKKKDRMDPGLEQLVEAMTAAQILKNGGRPVTPGILDQEEKRIDQQSLMPDLLGRVKAIFGADHEAYRRDYVLPTYAQRVIYYDYFLHDPLIQGRSLARAQAFLEKCLSKKLSPALFRHQAKHAGFVASRFRISPATGLEWESPAGTEKLPDTAPASPEESRIKNELKTRQNIQQSQEARRWIEQVINTLSLGGVYPKVVDDMEQWEIVQYIGKDKKTGVFHLQAVIIPKENYAKWLEDEKRKIKVIFFGPAL